MSERGQARVHVVEMIWSFAVASAGGGAGRFAIELGRRLDPRQFEVTLCALWNLDEPSEREQMERLAAQGIACFTGADWHGNRPYAGFVQSCRQIQSVLARRRVDILHSHSEFGDMAAWICKRALGSPLLMRTVHNGHRYEWRKRPLRRLLLTNLLYPIQFDAELGVSPDIAAHLNQRRVARLLGRQALCVPNAVDLGRFTNVQAHPAEKRRALGLPDGALVIGTVGRLAEGKGYETLLKAAALAFQELSRQPLSPVYWLVIGDGELAGALKVQAQQLGIADQVLFTGPRSDIEALYACLDLFVSPSLWEGLPTVILESMASGVPIVATDIPGHRQVIQDQVNGWLVPAGDPRALAEAVVRAIGQPAQRSEYARRSLGLVPRYGFDAVVAEHESLYLAALGRSMPG